MKSLRERLTKRKEEYEKLIEVEKLAERTARKLTAIIPREKIHAYVYNTYITFSVNEDSVETVELEYLPKLTEQFNLKWRKVVRDTSVSYNSDFHTNLLDKTKSLIIVYLELHFIPPKDGSCKIIPVHTGRTITEHKYVPVDVPEIEYLIECAEEV
jgi:hypothetical protein